MGRVILGFLLATATLGAGTAQRVCAPPEIRAALSPRLGHWSAEEAYETLRDPARLRRAFRELRAAIPELELDQAACALASAAGRRLASARELERLIEAYRSVGRPAEVSTILMGVFSRLPDDLLLEMVDRYQAGACRTPEPVEFDLRVAADALASTSRGARVRFVESVLKLYGPGSSVYYKTEANDCLVIVDRELAYAALGTLPEELRKRHEKRFEIFHH